MQPKQLKRPRGRPRKVPLDGASPSSIPSSELERAPSFLQEQEAEVEPILEGPQVPAHWGHGALLNVRNAGDAYVITLWPEEYDYRFPERGLRFVNPGECQDFVSKWYSRQSHDPRAI